MITHKSLLRMALATMSFIIPLTVQSASALVIADGIAGIGTELEASGLDAHARFSLNLHDPTGTDKTITLSADAQGRIRTFLPGNLLEHAGTYGAELQRGDTVTAETRFSIAAEDIDSHQSDILVRPQTIAADGEEPAEVTVILRDRYGNALVGRPIHLIGGTGAEEIAAVTGETDSEGMQRFLVVTHLPGLRTVRAIDLLSGEVLEETGEIEAVGGALLPMGGHRDGRFRADLLENAYAQEAADEIDHFQVTIDPSELQVNEVARSVLIQAVDRKGRIVRDYTGRVRITSPTDPEASLPGLEDGFGETTFTARERGEKNLRLVVSFTRSGEHVLRIEDRANPTTPIAGEATVRVVGGGGSSVSQGINLLSHKNGDAVNARSLTLTGTADPFVNIAVMVNGVDAAKGDTDQDGAFSIDVKLDASIEGAFTIRLQDASRRDDSGPINLTLDTIDPEIASITFAPEKPEEGTEALLVVKSEPKLPKVEAKIGDQTVTLTENAKEPGSYQSLFRAPAPGTLQPMIVVADRAGNSTELRATLAVTSKGLPAVKNLMVQGRANAAELTWDAIESDEVKAYRIYVGEEEGNFLYTLDSDRATTSATVAGLRPAQRYYFAVTAIAGERESTEKSNVASATILGTKFAVREDTSALHLQWTFPEDTPLASFLLEYGSAKGAYSEKRILNGALRSFALRDLLNGVRYHLRITPVATTGDLLQDLAAMGEGTPKGQGYHFAAPDNIPFEPSDELPPSNAYHEGAPKTPSTGLPPVAVWSGLSLAFGAVLLEWHRRRTLRMTVKFLQGMERRYKG